MNKTRKLTAEEYELNFQELVQPYNKNSAVAEASRCLYCYDSPCTKACPTHIDIPTFIKKIASGNLLGSAKTILQKNWVPLTCAKACPVGILCEGSCVFNSLGEKPIEIGKLQRYAIDNYFEIGAPKLFDKKPKNGKSVGIIGSGPSGLACAAELSLLGYEAEIYEASKVPGGLNTWGIAPYKTRRVDSLKEVSMIQDLGVVIHLETNVGESVSIESLLQKHDALFIGVGLGESGRLKIPGEKLDSVIDAIKFIEEVKREEWSSVDVGNKVVVVGAGNTAIDAATAAKRLGANRVSIIYRRTENEMPANSYEYQLAKNDGIVFRFLTSPVEILGDGQVRSLKCIRMNLSDHDTLGLKRPVPIPDSEFEIEADMVILALGQKAKGDFLESITGLEIGDNTITVNPETFQTGNAKVFAGGDCINGGKEVVNAAHDGKNAAYGIDKYLSESK